MHCIKFGIKTLSNGKLHAVRHETVDEAKTQPFSESRNIGLLVGRVRTASGEGVSVHHDEDAAIQNVGLFRGVLHKFDFPTFFSPWKRALTLALVQIIVVQPLFDQAEDVFVLCRKPASPQRVKVADAACTEVDDD